MRRWMMAAIAALSGCAKDVAAPTSVATTGAWTIDPGRDLNAFFECLEREGAALVSAHRGGYRDALPENALETMKATLDAVPALLEVDVAASADGVLYLMHDDTLERTTTGAGAVDALPFSEISKLRLEDMSGRATPFGPTRFADALEFARSRTILKVDIKKSARFEDVIAAIRAAGAERRVVLIAYALGAAQKLHRLAPEMMISLNMDDAKDLADAVGAGLPKERLLAFTGTAAPNPSLYDALNAADVEVIFGTLGRQGVDAMSAATGDDSQYAELSKIGVDILASDRPIAAQAALEKAGRAARPGTCGVRRD
ncbi:MAG: glycerophosphodiester phosphodiesterase family protein [Parvularculaceae bacterium]|nr:glycerophosphodiester phosphodiesterase family protein [Parvularculaceae bacterium]